MRAGAASQAAAAGEDGPCDSCTACMLAGEASPQHDQVTRIHDRQLQNAMPLRSLPTPLAPQVWAAFPAHIKQQGLTYEGLQQLYAQASLWSFICWQCSTVGSTADAASAAVASLLAAQCLVNPHRSPHCHRAMPTPSGTTSCSPSRQQTRRQPLLTASWVARLPSVPSWAPRQWHRCGSWLL